MRSNKEIAAEALRRAAVIHEKKEAKAETDHDLCVTGFGLVVCKIFFPERQGSASASVRAAVLILRAALQYAEML